MGVEAALDCLKGIDYQSIDGLYFASTTSPYIEKGASSIIAAACDLRRNLITADFGSSLRAGDNALRAATDAVKSGSAKSVLVIASDSRLAAPKSEWEPLLGDGATAFLIGDSEVAVSIEDSYSQCDESLDFWRMEGDEFVNFWEERFIVTEMYLPNLREATKRILEKNSLSPKDFAKVCLNALNARRYREAVRDLGFDFKSQAQDPFLFDRVGNTGCAFAPMMLVSALEEAKPGDRILYISYGDGCSAHIIKVNEQIENIKNHRGIKGYLESKGRFPSYERYLLHRRIVPWAGFKSPEYEISSYPFYRRERNKILRFHAGKCRQCGKIQYPPQRICFYCQAKDDYDEFAMSDKKATLFAYSLDQLSLAESTDMDPPTIQAVIDFEGGGRMQCMLTDRIPEKISQGMPIEMTFRKIRDSLKFRHYFWKGRPIRVP
jgi:3-hydroxy-3-methylglutaryl CoA synthase